MTCIFGLVGSNKTVYMGGDSRLIIGCNKTIMTDETKVKTFGEFIIGFSGMLSVTQKIESFFEFPTLGITFENKEAILKLALLLEQFCDEYDLDFSNNICLVGFRGSLYTIFSDFSVVEAFYGYEAIGSGRDYAMGAFAASLKDDYQLANDFPAKYIRKSLEIAAMFSNEVGEPFIIKEL